MNTRAAWLWPCLVLAACAPETIIVAYGPDAGEELDAGEAGPQDAGEDADARAPRDASSSDAFGPSGARGCVNNEGCRSDEVCIPTSCSDPRGTCVRPSLCNAEQDPVCGCDGVTYFNDCLRRQQGMGFQHDGECDEKVARPCHPFLPCDPDTRCKMLLFNRSCDPANFVPGKCWKIPDCSSRGEPRFQSCVPGAQGERQCVTACEAIKTEEPHTTIGCSGGPPRP
jgi:Kazal-type serine protease inhibitor domain